jgi:cytochrome c5
MKGIQSMQAESIRSISNPNKALAAALALATALSLAACAGGAAAMPKPTAKNVELAGRHGQVTTLPTLKVGRNLYIGRCGSCHSLKEPGFLTPADWPEMVGRMADNAKINADQTRAITQYLVSVSAAIHDSTSATKPAASDAAPPAPTSPN